jgi:hypothetical protein
MRRPTGRSALPASASRAGAEGGGRVELICVDPKRVHEIWPHVVHLIHGAVKRTNLSHTLDIDDDILHGHGLLWLACDGSKILAAMTTSLVSTDRDKVCILTACGGEEMKQWLPLLRKIEAYAKDEGCGCVRIYGRKGWARVLDGYRVEHVILERRF